VNFNCPAKLLEVFDETIKGFYSDRTDALLDAMRDLIRKLEEQKRLAAVAAKGA
jgi:metal-responsive CopG/Arc/MetJ family transcriptional regulator